MRLDKFLKVSRLIKRRTVANEACDAGRVRTFQISVGINPALSSYISDVGRDADGRTEDAEAAQACGE